MPFAPPPHAASAPAAVQILPIWERRASYAELKAVFPKAAEASHTEGRAALDCGVTDAGTLTACAVVSEIPAGAGFGEAAVSASVMYRLRPTDQRGQPVAGGRVRLSLRFLLPVLPLPPPAEGKLVEHPKWLRRPGGEDLARYFPDRATRLEQEGQTGIQCVATEEGALDRCEVLREDPAGFDFGAASLKLSRLFRMALTDEAGAPVAGRPVQLTIRWLNADD